MRALLPIILLLTAASLPPPPPTVPARAPKLRSPKAAEFQKSLGAKMILVKPHIASLPGGSSVVVWWDAELGDVLESSTDLATWTIEPLASPATIPAIGGKLFRVRRPPK